MSKETRTYSDRREYLKRAVIKRRKLVIQQAIAYKGNKRVLCGYAKCSRALVFHHLDPSQKDFGISHKGYTRSWERVRIELDKCALVCANCHAEIHEGITQLPGEIQE